MQGLRPLQAHQDENSTLLLRGSMAGKLQASEDGRSKGLGGDLSKATPARKALGNITNRSFGNENNLPGKTPANNAKRVFGGNLTNTNITTSTFPDNVTKVKTSTAVAPKDRIDDLFHGGVEKFSGKTWNELEDDRENQFTTAMLHRVQSFASAASIPPLHISKVHSIHCIFIHPSIPRHLLCVLHYASVCFFFFADCTKLFTVSPERSHL